MVSPAFRRSSSLLVLVGLLWAAAAQPALVPQVGCFAEWQQPTDILMHTPQEELFVGVIHPEAALFERPFSIAGAAAEHRAYIRLLERHGARVHTVVETLLSGTVDSNARAIPGPALDELRDFAAHFIHVDASALGADEQAEQKNYLSKTLHRLAHAGVLTSTRGRGGGFLLARSADQIPLLAVVGLFDQIEPRRQCLLGRPVCSDQHACEAHVQWKDVSERVARFFSETSVADLMGPGRPRGRGGDREPGQKSAAVARRR